LIASLVEDVTSSGIMVENPSLTSLPLHRYGVVVGDRELTNLASYSVHGPMVEGSLMIYTELEVHQRFGDSSINEEHSLFGKTSDQVGGGARIEPEIGMGRVVNYSWGNVVKSRGVGSSVDELAVVGVLAGDLLWMLEKVMCSQETNGERQCLVSV
jgi:hypothetical protein